MGKLLPVWLFLLVLFIGSLLTIAFGWYVKSAVSGGVESKKLGDAAIAVATFPDSIAMALRYVTEDPESYFRVPRAGIELADFHPVRMKAGIDVQGLLVRADELAVARAPGWRVLVGKFTLGHEVVQSALLFSPDLEIVKVWEFRDEIVPSQKPRETARTFIHGFVVLEDGSFVFATEGGGSLQRVDKCGKRIWSTDGVFNHAVSVDEDEEAVWAVNRFDEATEVVQVSIRTGEVVKRITMLGIIAANPMTDVLEVMQLDKNWRDNSRDPKDLFWLSDPFHINDVEPLPAAIADKFEDFKAGDLLLSARSLNLVFVVDPDSLEIKWWQSGPWRRQHDPDWQPTGEITVYDNRMGRDYSRILDIDPVSRRVRSAVDGGRNDFYSRVQGKHQITKVGNALVASTSQGRVFEVEPDGRMVFDMLNTDPENKDFNYRISEALWFPVDAFEFSRDFACTQ